MKYMILAKDCDGRVAIVMSQQVFETEEQAQHYCDSCSKLWGCIVVQVPEDWVKSLYN